MQPADRLPLIEVRRGCRKAGKQLSRYSSASEPFSGSARSATLSSVSVSLFRLSRLVTQAQIAAGHGDHSYITRWDMTRHQPGAISRALGEIFTASDRD